MKTLIWITSAILVLLLLFGLTQYLASERIEVVVLHTTDAAGEEVLTRLWVVDHEDYAYLRARQEAGWYQRLAQNPAVSLDRNGTSAAYTAVINPAKTEVLNSLMSEKYGWGDDFIGLMADRRQSIPVELHPR